MTAATPRPITYGALADLAEAMGLPGLAHLRRSAIELEHFDPAEVAGIEEISAALAEVPEPSKSTKHSDDCWQRHAWCLARRVMNGESA